MMLDSLILMDFSNFKKSQNYLFLRNETILKILTKFMTKRTAKQPKEKKENGNGHDLRAFFYGAFVFVNCSAEGATRFGFPRISASSLARRS